MKKVIAIQMFENESGSFEVFKQSILSLIDDGFYVEAITTPNQAKVLNTITGINTHILNKPVYKNQVLNFFMFFKIQIQLFIKALKMVKPDNVVYINSIYSVAPALVAKLKRAKLVCHLHSAKNILSVSDRVLKYIINQTADQVIFTSATLKDKFALTVTRQEVIYNTVSQSFIQLVAPANKQYNGTGEFIVLMISSSNAKQSINKLFQLADSMPALSFELLLTDWAEDEIPELFFEEHQPANLRIFPDNMSRHWFYQRASVLINLSSAHEHIGSGDIDVLQAMYYGIPVIVPATGGLQELISMGKHGIAINNTHLATIAQALNQLSTNTRLYQQISNECLKQAKLFNPNQFGKQLVTLFRGHKPRPYDNLIHLFGTAHLSHNIAAVKKAI